MSANEITIDPGGGSGDGDLPQLQELSDFGEESPQIVSLDGTIEFEPPVVTRVNGILPFETNTDQYLCGTTQVAESTDTNWRATIEGILFYRHLSTIKRLREESDGEVLFLAPMTVELGIERVQFDRIELDRPQDLNNRPVRHGTEVIEEPIYSFQFQSKEDENDE